MIFKKYNSFLFVNKTLLSLKTKEGCQDFNLDNLARTVCSGLMKKRPNKGDENISPHFAQQSKLFFKLCLNLFKNSFLTRIPIGGF